jgi:solute carrier family 25 protein 39/40
MPTIEDALEKVIVAVAPGFAFVAIGQPFDLIRVRLAAATAGVPAYAGAIDCATTTFRREGLLVFWKGAVPALLLNVPASGLFYGTYKHFQPPSPSPGAATADWHAHVFGAGVLAGLPTCTFSNPLEVWRVRAQTEVNSRLVSHSSSSGGSSGVRLNAPSVFQKLQAGPKHIFMRGFSLTMFRNVPGSGLYFLSYESAMHAMESRCVLNSHQDRALWAGGMVGFGFNLVFHPLEVVRVNVMNTDTGTVRAAVQELVTKGGYKALYRGVLTTTARAILLNASGLWVLESVQALVNTRRRSYDDSASSTRRRDDFALHP